MPRFYSPEWVAAFNRAVEGLDLAGVDTRAAAASEGRFRVDQLVHGGPAGDLVVTLVADGGHLKLELGAPPTKEDGSASHPQRADVTISLSYANAAAMSKGELDPADALGQGRVRVRGDLAVLVAGQALLAAASDRIAALLTDTTY